LIAKGYLPRMASINISVYQKSEFHTDMQLFPEQFDPQAWLGARKKAYTAHCDAFQQLLGDALLAHFQALAHVAATAGRDGAIDAWVEGNVRATGQFDGFCFPLIVECKHHDEATANTALNIKKGWDAVKKKLVAQAHDDWKGLYAPWKRAQGYLYCISARFPNQQARDDLQKEIRNFFSNLPAAQRPAFQTDQIRVWDWSDLQAWFNQNTILCDHWLGIDLPQWIDHLSLRERISQSIRDGHQSFQAYLLEENLAFVSPPATDPAHPQQLLQSLLRNENLLLVGEGGIGKTRTMHEVAELAAAKGWRVLHLLPAEREVDLASAANTILRPAQDTLVLIDYIDQLAHFDARYWRSTLLPQAQRRNVSLHLITNARPSGSSESLKHLQASGLFRTIEMTRDAAHRDSIAVAIEKNICPTAIAQIGQQAVKEHCGSRPIIAMFIAQALERLARNEELVSQMGSIPRSDDLLGWIRKRLREAELLPKPSSSNRWEPPPKPDSILVAIAAALAVCPFPMDELPAVIHSTFGTSGASENQINWIIGTLEKDGWVEAGEDGVFRTPHDAIPDEILREILDSPQRIFPDLLRSAFQGRPLGRFARSLGRLSGIAALAPVHKSSIESAAKKWLSDNALKLGQALIQNDSDTAAYALGALFDYPAWNDAAQTSWDDLIAPWIEHFGSQPAARHLIHRGLKSLPDNALLHPALSWLERNPELNSGSYILAPLLGWDTMRLDNQQEVLLDATIRWLEFGDNAISQNAEFVLSPLMHWSSDRFGNKQRFILSAALRWLGHANNAVAANAGFILSPLIEWDKARLGTHQGAVLDAAIRWLNHPSNSTAADARFIFNSLIDWDEARLGSKQQDILRATICWLKHPDNISSQSAGFVLPTLLKWSAEGLSEHQTTVLIITVGWLECSDNKTSPSAGFVLAPLLNWNSRRLDVQQDVIVAAAIRWLEHPENALAPDAQFVLNALLGWDEERLGHQLIPAMNTAYHWLENLDPEHFLIAGFVLPPLLRQRSLSPKKRSDYVLLASKWMNLFPGRDDATHLLKALLQTANQLSDLSEVNIILMHTAHWLDQNPDHGERGFVVARLLRLKKLPQNIWESIAEAGLKLLEGKAADRSDDYVLNGILVRLDSLPSSLHIRWAALTTRWMAGSSRAKDVFSVFNGCKKSLSAKSLVPVREVLVEASRNRADLRAYDWARPYPSKERVSK